MADRAFLERLSRDLTDQGKLIEAGWVGLRLAADIRSSTPQHLEELRGIFFAGAAHLFSSIMTILEPDSEPTDKDLARMSLIHRELEKFNEDFAAKHVATKGSA